MKKWFTSLMLGFGATLGVFVALAMPPGGWGVAIGVALGLLGCVPLLLITVLVLNRNNQRQIAQEPQQPVIIFQQSQPAQPNYEMYGAPQPYDYGYMEAPAQPTRQQYYFEPGYPEARPQRRYYRQAPMPRQPEPSYLPEGDYYDSAEEDFEPYYAVNNAPVYYEPRQPQPSYQQQYDPYYSQPYYAEPQPAPRPRPMRRAGRPANVPYGRPNGDSVVEADYRTIGD